MPVWINELLSKYGVTNIAGTVTAVLAGLVYVMDNYLGCNIGAAAAEATCNLPTWFPTAWVAPTMAIAAGVAFVSKLLRPGGILRSLFGGTAVIVPAASPASGPGTATPADVARP